jgi:MFS family permease
VSKNTLDGDRSAWRKEFADGWPILLAATLGCGAGISSLPVYTFGTFILPLQHEFGWSRGEVSSCFLCLTLTLALAGPLLGWLIDRVGSRAVALCSIPCLAGFFGVLSISHGPLRSFQICFAIAAVLGCGTSPVLYTGAVCNAFRIARGRALGITLAGTALAAVFLPPSLLSLFASHGWRGGFVALALLALVPWPFVFLTFPRVGYQRILPAITREGVSCAEAFCSRVFWTIAITFALIAVAVSALILHMVPLLLDAGLSPSGAASVASLMGAGIFIGRVGTGWLIDRYFAPYIAAAVFSITAIGCLAMLVLGPIVAPFAAVLIGLSLGAEVDLTSFLTSRYFGLVAYGRLYAVVYGFFVAGGALGPAIAGRMYDTYGNYQHALWLAFALLVAGSLALLSLPPYRTLHKSNAHANLSLGSSSR